MIKFSEREMIEGILVTAFEGGADWVARIKTLRKVDGAGDAVEQVALGGCVQITTDDGDKFLLDRVAMNKGIRMAAKLRNMNKHDWFDNHDAIEASNALQFALMGEIVYG